MHCKFGWTKTGNKLKNMIYTDEEKLKRIDEIAYIEFKKEIDGKLDDEEYDSFFEDAAREVVSKQQGSTSFLQRKFKLGYNRAERIMSQLEREKIVGASIGSKTCEVLIKSMEELENRLNNPIETEFRAFCIENKEDIQKKKQEYIDIQKKKQEEHKTFLLELEKREIKQKLLEQERKKQLHRQALDELIEEGLVFSKRKAGEQSREPISKDIMNQVWNRDGGKCVQCGSQENLEFDHIIPFSKGGATTYRNLQLLCQKCNREKSDKI